MSELFSTVARSGTAGQAVEQHIKELIKARRLLAGDKLPPERQLAERLDVSRSTLRGSLQSLAEQGVLTGKHGAGWTVEPSSHIVAANLAVYLSLEEVSFGQLFAARRAVEPHIAAGAAQHRTEAQLAALERCIQVMRATPDNQVYLQADSDFHAILAAASQNPVFSMLITPTLTLLQDVRERLSAEQSVISASHDEHDRILSAVRAGDAGTAKLEMTHHIDRFVASGSEVLNGPAGSVDSEVRARTG